MRYLGIDYGSKRVGLALSDEAGVFALPLTTLQNADDLVGQIVHIIIEKEVGGIVIGESKNFKGEDNKIMKGIRQLKEDLEKEVVAPVVLEPEFLTSHQAEHFQGKHDKLDASAAAIILQSYLDRRSSRTPNPSPEAGEGRNA